jgi:Enhancer of polycomb-like
VTQIHQPICLVRHTSTTLPQPNHLIFVMTANSAESGGGAATAAAPTKKTAVVPPPSLNVYRKIAVIRSIHDRLAYEDTASGQVQSVSVRELGDAMVFQSHHDQHNDQQQKATTEKSKEDIPVPQIRTVASYEQRIPPSYCLPRALVRNPFDPIPDHWKVTTVEYVLDQEDDAWIQKYYARDVMKITRRRPSLAQVHTVVERMIDVLEKETGFDVIPTQAQAESLYRALIPELFTLFPAPTKSTAAAATAGPLQTTLPTLTSQEVLNEVVRIDAAHCMCVHKSLAHHRLEFLLFRAVQLLARKAQSTQAAPAAQILACNIHR